MSDFDSLTWALDGWFDKPLLDLPDALRQRVERDFPVSWDALSPDQRRSVALQSDYQHDPATKQDQQYWWDFFVRKDAVKQKIAEWEAIATPTAGDLRLKETRLVECQQELARMEAQQRQARGDYYPERRLRDDEKTAPSTNPDAHGRYIAYPNAFRLLSERLGATPEELAAWVFRGDKGGGLMAYTNANELDPPPRFFFGYFTSQDYLSPLMACWFRTEDIARFDPAVRYITGKTLLERWSDRPSIQPEAFIRAKIAESRLHDLHPTWSLTQGTNPEDPSCPPMTSALFSLSDVEDIEAEDFGFERSVVTGTRDERLVGSAEWRRQNAIAAANAKHSQPGGSREKQNRMRAAWASGKYASRDRCAEEECAALGMSYSAARKALRNTPEPERT